MNVFEAAAKARDEEARREEEALTALREQLNAAINKGLVSARSEDINGGVRLHGMNGEGLVIETNPDGTYTSTVLPPPDPDAVVIVPPATGLTLEDVAREVMEWDEYFV